MLLRSKLVLECICSGRLKQTMCPNRPADCIGQLRGGPQRQGNLCAALTLYQSNPAITNFLHLDFTSYVPRSAPRPHAAIQGGPDGHRGGRSLTPRMLTAAPSELAVLILCELCLGACFGTVLKLATKSLPLGTAVLGLHKPLLAMGCISTNCSITSR